MEAPKDAPVASPRTRALPRVGLDAELQQADEARARAFGADALDADAGAFAEQEYLVGQQLGLGETGFPAEAYQLLPVQGLVFLDHAARRMILLRQFHRYIQKGAAALGEADLELADMAQPGQELAHGIAGMGPGILVPGRVEVRSELAQALGDQQVLRFEMAVEEVPRHREDPLPRRDNGRRARSGSFRGTFGC